MTSTYNKIFFSSQPHHLLPITDCYCNHEQNIFFHYGWKEQRGVLNSKSILSWSTNNWKQHSPKEQITKNLHMRKFHFWINETEQNLKQISLWVDLDMNFVAVWQSRQILRFLTTRMERPGGTTIKPKTIGSLSLWFFSIRIFSESSTSWRTELRSGL